MFYDLEALRAGRFNEALLDSIQACNDFALILSPTPWTRCGDAFGLFADESARRVKTRDGSPAGWLLRSAGGGIGFRSVTTDGYAGSGEYGPSGVALGFCL